ncbi:MCE family protein [bacterium]|nr:MAG: MCE family protein [bacterium]
MDERLKDKDSRFKRLEIKIGVLVFIAILGIAAIVALVGIKSDIFTKKFVVSFATDSGAGFIEGMPVKLSGFKIGRVKTIELSDTARVKVTLEINKKYQRWLRRGTVAKVGKEGFIGESAVDVSSGGASGELLKDNDVIIFEKARGIEDLVEQVKPVLQEVRDIIHYVNDPAGDIKQTLANVKAMSAEFRVTKAKVDGVIDETGAAIKKVNAIIETAGSQSKTALESTAKIMKNLEATTMKIEPVMDKVGKIAADAETAVKRLPVAMEKIEKTVDNVKGITEALSGETPKMKDLLGDVRDAAKDGKALVKGLRESWPGSSIAPKLKEPSLVPLDGFLPAPAMEPGKKEK